MVASYLGFKPREEEAPGEIEEQDVIPATKVSAEEFQDLLRRKGLIQADKAQS